VTRTVRINRDRLWASLTEHDAQEISAVCPTAMVFVAGENGGISHTPREHSNPDACGNGTDVLANAVLRPEDQP
jgi:N-carbamoyl-L-amino-acid hydrolase